MNRVQRMAVHPLVLKALQCAALLRWSVFWSSLETSSPLFSLLLTRDLAKKVYILSLIWRLLISCTEFYRFHSSFTSNSACTSISFGQWEIQTCPFFIFTSWLIVFFRRLRYYLWLAYPMRDFTPSIDHLSTDLWRRDTTKLLFFSFGH